MSAEVQGLTVSRARPDRHTPELGARAIARALWLAVGVVSLALAVALIGRDGTGLAPVVAFLVLPDLAFVAGVGAPAQRGQLPARAVPFYNAAHGLAGPLMLMVLGVVGVLPHWWLIAGLAWISHIAIDRGFGFGPRTSEGWQRV
jgi:hypothetical protein